MRITAGIDGLDRVLADTEERIAEAATGAMREGVPLLRDELSDQVRRAGLAPVLARTWRGNAYPRTGDSLDPAGYVYSKAPDIISAYASGATLRPINGAAYLAIPTASVPRGRGRGRQARMTPDDVESYFNQDLILRRGRRGTLLGFVNVVAARGRAGLRQATKGRLAQGRQAKLVLMFVFVREVRVAKLLDIDGAAQRAAAYVGDAIRRRLGTSA